MPASLLCRRLEAAAARLPAWLLLCGLGLAAPIVSAQPAAPSFRHLTIDEGLSQNAVFALLQDRLGFLWIGTKDGLNRYDGYAFSVVRHDPADPATLSSSYVTALLEGRDGTLWVGTHDGGLNRFNPATGAVTRYRHGPRSRVTALAEDADGRLWAGTRQEGVFVLAGPDRDRPDAPFRRLVHRPDDPGSLSSDRVNALLVGRGGTVWIGSDGGLDRLPPGGARVVRHAQSSGGPSDPWVTALLETRDGTLWVGSPTGLDRLEDPAAGRFTAYPYPTQRRGYGWAVISALVEGPDGALWLGTFDGLMHFDPDAGTYTTYRHRPDAPRSLAYNSLNALLWDRTDVLWVGTNGYGLDRHDAKTAGFATIRAAPLDSARTPGFSVRAVFEDRAGDLWISAGVLYRREAETGRFVSYETTSARPADFGNTGAWSVAQDRRGRLWFASDEGLYRYTPDTGDVRRYAHDPGRPASLPGKAVYGAFADRRGTVWAVTAHHLSRLDDPSTGRFTHFVHTPPTPTGPSDPLFPSLHESADGVFWMGSNQGLVRFDPRTGAVRRYRAVPGRPETLGHEQVRAVCPDPDDPDVLWLGTGGGGLARFDRRTETFRHVTRRDGLPNNVVYGVLPDGEGRLWLSTNHGLARYDRRTGDVQTFEADDGLQSNEFNAGAAFRAADGRLFFGGIHGVTAFDPAAVRVNPHVPPVVLTGLRVSNRPVAPGDDSGVLARALPATDAVRLAYDQNMVTFEFAALDFSAPERNRYAYRMEGFDDGWIDAGAARTATYTNLPPGRYAFRVRAANASGLWNEVGTALAVVITPPPWRTWWAYLAYAFLALGAAGTLARYHRNRLTLKHQLELEHLEAEKLRELDRSRSRFFANVSHEFRTPLTLTIGPLDDLCAGLYGPLAPPVVEQLALARRNADRVLALINQILDVARLEAGRMELRAERLDVAAVLARVGDPFQALAARRQMTFETRVPDAPLSVWADPGHLEKVLTNLLSNAFKYTPQGGTVRLAARAEAGMLRLDVRDSGPGIPAADLPFVFDRFYCVNESSAHLQPGTGIGLALAQELVDLHGGTLTVESEEGFGSTFVVTLPLGCAHLADDQIAPPAAGDPAADEPVAATAWTPSGDGHQDGEPDVAPAGDGDAAEADADRTTVLVVDDHADVRAFLRRHLEPTYRVVEAADGDAGLAAARAFVPDLVLSDVMMPGRDGYDLCHALKTDPETDFIPVILLTARAAPEDRLEGLHEHADDYLTKPFDVAELRARIDNLIASRARLRLRFEREGRPSGGRAARFQPASVEVVSDDDAFLDRVHRALEEHLSDETFGVADLADAVGVSRGHLHRQLRALLDLTPSEALYAMRLARAAQLLKGGAGSVGEVAYGCGFKSLSHFSRKFRDRYGVTPSAYAAGARA